MNKNPTSLLLGTFKFYVLLFNWHYYVVIKRGCGHSRQYYTRRSRPFFISAPGGLRDLKFLLWPPLWHMRSQCEFQVSKSTRTWDKKRPAPSCVVLSRMATAPLGLKWAKMGLKWAKLGYVNYPVIQYVYLDNYPRSLSGYPDKNYPDGHSSRNRNERL